MNKYLVILVLVLITIIGVGGTLGWRHIKALDSKWTVAEGNVKSYSSMISTYEKKNTALQLTVDQLGYFNDSVLNALNETRKELNIKDKNLKALQQLSSSFSKKDTVYLDSIIFKEPTFQMDTIIGDEWYRVELGLKYPSMVAVSPTFKSVKHIAVSTKKETVNPPKKCWLLRLFQKKHKVLTVDVIEKNPHCEDQGSRYIEIMK